MQDVVLTNLVQEGSALETLRHLCNMHDHTTLRVIVIEAWEQNEVQQVPRVWNHASQAWRLDNESWHPDAMMWSNSDVCPYTYEKHMGFSLCLCFLLNGISFSHALRFRNHVMIFTVWRCTFMGQPAKTTGGVSIITQTQASATTLMSWVPWPSHQDKISHSHGNETVLNNSLYVNHWFQTFPGLETFFFK